MNSFTHHNTTVNIIDVIVAKPGFVLNDQDIPDDFKVPIYSRPPSSTSCTTSVQSLDDNTDAKKSSPSGVEDFPKFRDTDLPQPSAIITGVSHPPHIRMKAVLLDSFDHLVNAEDVPAVKMK